MHADELEDDEQSTPCKRMGRRPKPRNLKPQTHTLRGDCLTCNDEIRMQEKTECATRQPMHLPNLSLVGYMDPGERFEALTKALVRKEQHEVQACVGGVGVGLVQIGCQARDYSAEAACP